MDFKLNKSNLNFRVYTATATPATGGENDICVVSDVPMENWILSPDAPVGAPRNDGDVWFQYSVTGNTFNTVKNNSMLIAVISTKQYIDGAWVNKFAKCYRNGEWVDLWHGKLFENGETFSDITGGWTSSKGSSESSKGSLSYGSDGIYVYGNRAAIWAHPKNTINLTHFNYLRANVTMANKGTRLSIAALGKDTSWARDDYAVIQTITGTGLVTLDVSSLSGDYYVALGAHDDAGKQTSMRVSEVYLEK
jgi:hypothetical protein